MKKRSSEELQAAAAEIERQAIEANGEYGIPVDPDVAEFMRLDDEINIYVEGEGIPGHELIPGRKEELRR